MDYKSSLKLIDGNELFNAGFFTPLSITTIKKIRDENIEVIYSHIDHSNSLVNLYKDLDKVSIHGDDIVLRIRNKIFSKMDKSISDKLFRNGSISKIGKYLKICRISGHPPKKVKI